MASIARYERGETAVFTATLRDKDGAAIAAASLTSLSLTLTDAHSGGVVNSRNAQNVLSRSPTRTPAAWSTAATRRTC